MITAPRPVDALRARRLVSRRGTPRRPPLEFALSSLPDGTRLFRRSWLPRQPQRTLALVHGFAEHSGRYDHVGAWFATRDFAVHAYDHRGHGRSDGERGHVDSFSQLLDDLESFLDLVRGEHPELPLVLMGHSLGGLVVADAARRTKAGSALRRDLGAAAGVGPGRFADAVAHRAHAATLRATSPARCWHPLDDLSRDAEVGACYDDDPLVFKHATASFAAEALDAVARTGGAGMHVQVPLLLLHGEADRVCPPRGSRAFHGQLRGSGHRLRVYPKLRHEILNEPEQEQVFEDVLAWVLEREA